MSRITLLPHWVITDIRPAFYDSESATAIEQTGKIYGAMRELQKDYNSYVDELNKAIKDFEDGIIKDQSEFMKNINKIMHDYIKMIDEKIKLQDKDIAEAIEYMKTNLSNSITSMLAEMKELGEVDELIADSFNNLATRVEKLENTKPIIAYDEKLESLTISNLGGDE